MYKHIYEENVVESTGILHLFEKKKYNRDQWPEPETKWPGNTMYPFNQDDDKTWTKEGMKGNALSVY